MTIKVLSVFGTRPEAIKMAPLLLELQKRPEFESLCCLSGQHRELLDSVMEVFGLHADFDLDIMEQQQTLSSITSKTLLGMDAVLEQAQPDLVLVHGDTSTSFAGALSAFFHKIPVGHVEAGLRTYDRYSPFPEEMNRTLTADLASLHFSPTKANAENLRKENVRGEIFVTGNTVIDAMQTTVRPEYRFSEEKLRNLDFESRRVITLTCHRRENYGASMRNIMEAMLELSEQHEDIDIVYPVHLSPAVRQVAFGILAGTPRVHLIDPIDVVEMHNLMARSYMVLTDSGGLQEEAPAMGKPVLVLRRETERPEAVEAGTVKIAGTEKEKILALANELLCDPTAYQKMAKAVNPYGDGKACARIAEAILYHFGQRKERPNDFHTIIQ